MKQKIILLAIFSLFLILPFSYFVSAQTTCVDSDEIRKMKEIREGDEKDIAGLNVYVISAQETNLALEAKLRVGLIDPPPYSYSIEVDLTDKNFKKEIFLSGDKRYTIELISVSEAVDGSVIIEVSNSGKDYYKAGTADDSNAIESDLCLVQGGAFLNIIESFCENGVVTTELHECPYGCSDGACIPKSKTVKVIRGDVNGDGIIDLSDVIYLLDYLFRGGRAPPAPFPEEAVCTIA